jgi:predicted nucleic acid-binding protein
LTRLAIVDTGPLYAAVNSADPRHDACVEVLSRGELHLIVPALVVAEATYLVGRNLGPGVEAGFLAGVGTLEVTGPSADDFDRIVELVEQYSDFPLGGTDASVIALAERLDASVVITLDRRHFGAVQARHRGAFELLP